MPDPPIDLTPPEPAPPRPECAPASGPTYAAALTPLFDAGVERDAVERVLLALAVHPGGAGLERAWFLVWNPRRGNLEGWLCATREPAAIPLADAVARAMSVAPEGEAAARVRALRAFAFPPAGLDRLVAGVWAGAGTVVGGPCSDTTVPWHGAASIGVAAVSCAGRPYALLVGDWRPAVDADADPDPAPPMMGAPAGTPADEVRKAALEAWRLLAGAALSAVYTAREAKTRRRQAAALAELTGAAVSAIHLTEALQLATRLAAQASGARGSALWIGGAGGALRLEATHGPAAQRERIARTLEPLAAAAVEQARPQLDGPPDDGTGGTPDAAGLLEPSALVPLLAYGRPRGALAVYGRAVLHPSDAHGFDPSDLEFLGTLANLVALTLDQATRFDELRRTEQQRREIAGQLRREEHLASLGEMAVGMAREARQPLTSIAAFARRVHRALPESDPHRDCLEIVIREAERLESLMGGPLQYAALEPPRLRVQSLNAVLQEALQGAGETLVRRRVRLVKKLAPDLPPLLLDAARIRRVVENLLQLALDAVTVGGRIRVESRRVQQFVVVEVAHDGPRQPGQLIEQLFAPFASGAGGGAAVGLGLAQQLVREHGGEIRLRSEGEWSAICSFTLPIAGNQDRRRNGVDRRQARGNRRGRYPAG